MKMYETYQPALAPLCDTLQGSRAEWHLAAFLNSKPGE